MGPYPHRFSCRSRSMPASPQQNNQSPTHDSHGIPFFLVAGAMVLAEQSCQILVTEGVSPARCAFSDNRHISASVSASANLTAESHLILSRSDAGDFVAGFDLRFHFPVRSVNFAITRRIHFQITAGLKFGREQDSFAADGHARGPQDRL